MNTPATVTNRPVHSSSNVPAGFGDIRQRPKKRDKKQVEKEKQQAQERKEARQRMLKALDTANGYTGTYGPLRADGFCAARAVAAQICGVRYRAIYAPRSSRHIKDVIDLTEKEESGKPQNALLRSRACNVPVSWELEGAPDDYRPAQEM